MEDLKARKKKREKINSLVAERLASNPQLDEKTARVQINREAVLRIRSHWPLITNENLLLILLAQPHAGPEDILLRGKKILT
jgi:hypothetical protein